MKDPLDVEDRNEVEEIPWKLLVRVSENQEVKVAMTKMDDLATKVKEEA